MTSHSPCLEVAISTTKEPTAFETLQRQAHLDLATFPGFINGIALRDADDSATHADLILWSSASAARASAKVIQQDKRFSSFMQSIESVPHFAHYSGASLEAMNRLVKSPVVEVTVYKPRQDSDVTALRASVYEALRNIEGASPQVAGTCIDDALTLIDLIGWQNTSLLETAPDTLTAHHPELKSFFSNIEKIEVKALFEVMT